MLINIFLVFACSDTYQNIYSSHSKFEKNTELNKLSELEYRKTPSQMSFLGFACSYKYRNIYSFFRFEIRKKNWAKWTRWARILKSPLTDEQLHSRTCFLVFACSNKHQYTSLLILHKIEKKIEKNSIRIFYKKIIKNM